MKLPSIRKSILIIPSMIVVVCGFYYFWPEKSLPQNVIIDNIIVDKSEHKMDVFSKDELIKTYKISLGRGEWGWEDRDWNNKTPIGGSATISMCE